MESIQHNIGVAVTGAVRCTSGERLYQELGLESLRKRRYSKYLKVNLRSIFSKYFVALAENIIQKLIITFYTSVLNIIYIFPSTVIEWNNLALKIRNSGAFSGFKKSILKFKRPFSNSISNCHSPNGIKLLD